MFVCVGYHFVAHPVMALKKLKNQMEVKALVQTN